MAKTKAARLDRSVIQFSEWAVHCRDNVRRIVQCRYRLVDDFFLRTWWDATAQRQSEEYLRQLAVSDLLTGVWNRRRLLQDIGSALERTLAGGPGCSLLAIDIDHFTSINDRFGHPIGDEVLRLSRSVVIRCCGELMFSPASVARSLLFSSSAWAALRLRLPGSVCCTNCVGQLSPVPGLAIDISVSIGLATSLPG